MGKILLVDDYEDARNVLSLFLTSSGHEVVEAENGRQAVEAADGPRFDAVIMDLSLPELDGLSAVCRLREREGWGGVPVIACTAFVSEGHRRAAAAVGCDAYFVKPLDVEAFGRALADLLASGRSGAHRIASENMSPDELLDYLDSLSAEGQA